MVLVSVNFHNWQLTGNFCSFCFSDFGIFCGKSVKILATKFGSWQEGVKICMCCHLIMVVWFKQLLKIRCNTQEMHQRQMQCTKDGTKKEAADKMQRVIISNLVRIFETQPWLTSSCLQNYVFASFKAQQREEENMVMKHFNL